MTAILLVFTLISNASAVQYWQWKEQQIGENTTRRLHTVVVYDSITKDLQSFNIWALLGFQNPVGFNLPIINTVTDAIEGGKPLEVLVQYYSYVDDWNIKNPEYKVNHCNLTISISGVNESVKTTLFSKLYNTEINNAKYFVRMDKGDTMYADFECLFENKTTIEIPADITIILPTWECQACQYYEWTQDFINLNQADTLQTYISNIWDYMKEIVNLNFEVILIFYYIFLIGIVLLGVGLIFAIMYWIFLFVRKQVK